MSARSLLKGMAPVAARYTGASSVIARRYRGRGTIFMLHSVVDDAAFYPDRTLRCPVSSLERILRWLRANKIDIISLDDAIDRIDAPSTARFAVLTFDDGYADALTHALPLMERFRAPFVVYVTTGMMTGNIDAWWLGLAELIRRQDMVELSDLGLQFDCRDEARKVNTFVDIERMIHTDYSVLQHVKAAIASQGIDCGGLAKREAMTVEDLRQLAAHPLATVGAHGCTHANLAMASASAARWEMEESRRLLEDAVQKPILHFAYPFGNARACGPREAELARASGYRSAVTTRSGSIFPQHRDHLHALPREALSRLDTSSTLRCKVDGFYRAGHSRLGDPVAAM